MKNKGFTLLELLVVISLLAILATIIINSFTNTLKKGRDSRRKQDLEEISKALELYNDDNSSYPASLSWGNPMSDPDTPAKFYMRKIPQDPSNSGGLTYYYQTGTTAAIGSWYKLYSCLENDQDASYSTYVGTICSSETDNCQTCHFGISSPNTTL